MGPVVAHPCPYALHAKNTTSPAQHVQFTHLGQIPKAMAPLTSDDKRMSVLLIDEDFPIQVTHMKTQVNALGDPTPSLGILLTHWFKSWGTW